MVCPFYYIAETEMEMEEWQSERKHEAEKEPGSVVFVMNFGHGPAEISVPGAWRDAESGESCGAALCLEPLSCRILERED